MTTKPLEQGQKIHASVAPRLAPGDLVLWCCEPFRFLRFAEVVPRSECYSLIDERRVYIDIRTARFLGRPRTLTYEQVVKGASEAYLAHGAPTLASPPIDPNKETFLCDAAVAYRARVACDLLEGFTDGIDGDRLGELARWTTRGRALDQTALLRAFAAPWIAAQDEAGWQGDPDAEARKDLDRHTQAALLASASVAAQAFDVESYVAAYEFRTDDGGGYTPNETEKTLITDAIHGALLVAAEGRSI